MGWFIVDQTRNCQIIIFKISTFDIYTGISGAFCYGIYVETINIYCGYSGSN